MHCFVIMCVAAVGNLYIVYRDKFGILELLEYNHLLCFESRFRNLMGLKFLIEKGLDQLASSRQVLLDRLMEIDQTMENPRDDDIDRIRNCRNCHNIPEGCLCVHCELDELFQVM